MVTREDIEQFYRDVKDLNLKFPVASISETLEVDRSNVSKILSRKNDPSRAFLKKFYEKFSGKKVGEPLVVNGSAGAVNAHEKYVQLLERDRDLFEQSLKNNLNLMTANLTELLKYQKYERSQVTALLQVSSQILAAVQKRDPKTVAGEINRMLNGLISAQQ